nr:immunoglobulin heavy chain junction region [Mus musculus]MBK4196787.1 immunoglobulin heavy chain junction region [Mus musculus]MBK4196788.1 immunoglobulin heavy chain junction region [Mus musculus]MBK4196789.1 immunoglobulin heavy chain junction region [Mus musculus]MBK4196790.1 immunoglobulin heavy chain junction region [Mus musculus]
CARGLYGSSSYYFDYW